MAKKVRFPAVAESVFDLAYLIFGLTAGIILLSTGTPSLARTLYGAMALVLGGGDAFHLLPRVYGQLNGKLNAYTKALGLGKLITSITMTAFYLLLYAVWVQIYGSPLPQPLTVLLLALAAARLILCLCPQNRWFSQHPSQRWAVYRNIPFLCLGIIIILLFALTTTPGDPLRFLPLAVALSFGFYLPVVLLSQKIPAIGALMLPKTLAYVWIICMGFAL